MSSPVAMEQVVLPTSYTAKEVTSMSAETLLAEFTRITGHAYLACKHCHRQDVPLTKFVYAIQKRCGKKGLSEDMKLPATCDVQLKKNEVRNKTDNPINNTYYPLIRKAATEEMKKMLKAARVAELAAMAAKQKEKLKEE